MSKPSPNQTALKGNNHQKALCKSKSVAFVWLLVVVLTMLVAVVMRGIQFDTSIMALLPKGEQNPHVEFATDSLANEVSKQALLVVSSANENDARRATKIVGG